VYDPSFSKIVSVFTVIYKFASDTLKVPRPYNIDGQFIAF